MKAVEELIGAPGKPARAIIGGWEAFTAHLAAALRPEPGRPLTVEDVAAAFRQFYRLPVPIAPHINALLENLGIALGRHSNPEDPDACSAFDADTQRWEIFVRYDVGRRESLYLLQEVFRILHQVSLERIPWWEDQAAGFGRLQNAASSFAYALVLPPASFIQQALCCGLNPWTLAAQYVTTPGACFYALSRHLKLPFPYFQVQLNFAPELCGQQQFFFQARGVRAEVWKKSFKRAHGQATEAWPEMLAIRKAFPRIGQAMETNGILYQAIKTGRPQCAQIGEIGGCLLPRPVCLVARPNGTAQSQMFVQIVPTEYAALLRDETLYEPEKEAAEGHPGFPPQD